MDCTRDEECQKAWSCLRNNYRKALKNRVYKSGEAAKKRRPIKFEKELEFLQKFFQDRPQLSNLDYSSEDTQRSEDTQHLENTQPPETILKSSVPFPEAQSPVSQMSSSSHASDSRPARHVRQRSYMSSEAHHTETRAEVLKKYIENQKKEQHPMEIFFQAIAATAKLLSPKLQAEIKRDVLRIVTDAEIKHLDNEELASVVQRSRPSTSSSGFDISNDLLQYHSSQQYTPTSVARTHNTRIERTNSNHNFSPFNTPEQQYNIELNYRTEYIPTPISRGHNNNNDTYENNSNTELPEYEK